MKKYYFIFIFVISILRSDLYSQYKGGSYDGYYSKLDTNIAYPVGIKNISEEASDFQLYQNYPNPFNPITNLEFGISKLGFVTLKIYDMLGKEVATLIKAVLNPGTYKYNFDASGLSSGIYFYKLTVNGSNSNGVSYFTDTKKMILIK